MHYVANTTYFAGNRDHNGLLEGEASAAHHELFVNFANNPIRHKLRKMQKFAEFLKDNAPQFDFEIIGIDHDNRETYETKYTFGGYADKWHECPFDSQDDAERFLYALQNCDPKFATAPTVFGKGKKRELETARHSAIWPDATDEQLSLPKDELTQLLNDRLPALLEEFRIAVESIGFTF